jgi:hypothetical protein
VDENLSLAGTLGNRAYTPYQGQRVAGFTDDQNAAFNTVRQLPNQYGGMVANANQALTNAATPVQPQGYNPATFQASQAQAAMMPSAQGYDAASGASNMAQYQNPFTEQVINAGMNDLNRSYQMSLSGIGARAAGAGAYGGSRQGVAEAEAAKNFMDSAGQLSAGLRSQGFNTAAGLGQGDAASQNAARAFGAGSQNAAASQNSRLATQAALANAASQNAALEASANAMNQSGEFNAQQANAVNQANVASQLAAGQAFGGLAGQTQTLGMNSANALAGIGQQQQGLNQAQMDLNYGISSRSTTTRTRRSRCGSRRSARPRWVRSGCSRWCRSRAARAGCSGASAGCCKAVGAGAIPRPAGSPARCTARTTRNGSGSASGCCPRRRNRCVGSTSRTASASRRTSRISRTSSRRSGV